LESGGREGIRTLGLLVANEDINLIRRCCNHLAFCGLPSNRQLGQPVRRNPGRSSSSPGRAWNVFVRLQQAGLVFARFPVGMAALASSCRRVHLRSFGERNQQGCGYEPSNAGREEPTTEASRRLDDGPHGVGSNKTSEIPKTVDESNSCGR